jgi:glycosyltransferase involved in cell wall biosynthesis
MCANTPDLAVCALVPYPTGTTPSQRFRLEQWAPHLKAAGIAVTFQPFLGERLMRLLQQPGRWTAKAAGLTSAFACAGFRVPAMWRYDAIVVHRAAAVAGPAWLEWVASWSRRPIIFDFDDAIFFLHCSAANRRFAWLKFPSKTEAICRLSRQIVVGNNYLADYARQFNRHVTVIPSSVDLQRYQPRVRPANRRPVVIGWTGSSTSQTYLESFAPILAPLLRRGQVELRVHSDRRPELPGIPLVWRPWSAATEVQEIAAFDIGIMPMPEDPWARGKCAMKALLYMALEVPAVCSAVGANCELIRHGENGLLASSAAEWVAALDRLIADPELRTRMGRAGRQTVEEHYSMQRCAVRFADVVREAARTKPS